MPKRDCSNCTLCCVVTEIKALGKKINEPCLYICSKGCAIHKGRPAAFRRYACQWLVRPDFSEDLRPDLCGVVFEKLREVPIVIIQVDPERKDAWMGPLVQSQIYKLRSEGLSVAVTVGPGDIKAIILSDTHNIKNFWDDVKKAIQVVEK